MRLRGLLSTWLLMGSYMLADCAFLVNGGTEVAPPELQLVNDGRWALGGYGRAVQLTADSASSVILREHPAINVGAEDFTISLWLCPDDLKVRRAGEYRRIFLHIGKKVFYVLDVFPDGQLMFSMKDLEGNYASTRSNARLQTGRWQHVAVRINRQAFTTTYVIDGAVDSVKPHSKKLTGTLDEPRAGLVISTWGDRKYVGLLGAFRLRQSLVADEALAAEYAAERERYSDTSRRLLPAQRKLYATPVPAKGARQTMWNMERLGQVPETFAVETEPFAQMKDDAVRPLMYAGEPYRGRPTRVFAWLGLPKGASPEKPVPGIVLVHGGGGTAFRNWVRTWNERGYAAIAMDTCGHVPLPLDSDGKPWPKHEWSGPAGWGGFGQMDEPVSDHWTYHAVSSVILGHSLLRSLPQVDASRVGLTGISWGGYLTNIVAGVDQRFRFAVPVYGCGFIGEGSAWTLREMGDEKAQSWVKLWDPAMYIGGATMPMLYCNGTNDRFYRPPIWHRTTLLPVASVVRSYKIRMPHGHGRAGDPPEVLAFADAHCRDGRPLMSWGELTVSGHRLTATVETHGRKVVKASVAYTSSHEEWPQCQWQSAPAEYDAATGVVKGKVPHAARAAYLDVVDEQGLLTSSPLFFFHGEAGK